MLKIAIVVVVLLIAGVLILAALKPDVFRVERSASIKAPPEKVYALINDFKAWTIWSPWEKKDPAMKRSYGAVTTGKGATYGWDGNNNVGQGSMEITDAVAASKIELKIDFVKPMEGHNTIVFTLTPQGEMTQVNWSMQGSTPFIGKIFHVFMNMDKMVGGDFEAGLANLRAAAEKN
jgi:uncharacterized protein YndB with AHSA1/START domain